MPRQLEVKVVGKERSQRYFWHLTPKGLVESHGLDVCWIWIESIGFRCFWCLWVFWSATIFKRIFVGSAFQFLSPNWSFGCVLDLHWIHWFSMFLDVCDFSGLLPFFKLFLLALPSNSYHQIDVLPNSFFNKNPSSSSSSSRAFKGLFVYSHSLCSIWSPYL